MTQNPDLSELMGQATLHSETFACAIIDADTFMFSPKSVSNDVSDGRTAATELRDAIWTILGNKHEKQVLLIRAMGNAQRLARAYRDAGKGTREADFAGFFYGFSTASPLTEFVDVDSEAEYSVFRPRDAFDMLSLKLRDPTCSVIVYAGPIDSRVVKLVSENQAAVHSKRLLLVENPGDAADSSRGMLLPLVQRVTLISIFGDHQSASGKPPQGPLIDVPEAYKSSQTQPPERPNPGLGRFVEIRVKETEEEKQRRIEDKRKSNYPW